MVKSSSDKQDKNTREGIIFSWWADLLVFGCHLSDNFKDYGEKGYMSLMSLWGLFVGIVFANRNLLHIWIQATAL